MYLFIVSSLLFGDIAQSAHLCSVFIFHLRWRKFRVKERMTLNSHVSHTQPVRTFRLDIWLFEPWSGTLMFACSLTVERSCERGILNLCCSVELVSSRRCMNDRMIKCMSERVSWICTISLFTWLIGACKMQKGRVFLTCVLPLTVTVDREKSPRNVISKQSRTVMGRASYKESSLIVGCLSIINSLSSVFNSLLSPSLHSPRSSCSLTFL